MGPESKIELGSGTLYFNGMGCQVGTIEIEDFEAAEPIDMPELNKIINENVEFTGTVTIKFRGLVVLMGFWPAVKWTVCSWWNKVKKYWRMLRTPIEDEED